MKRQHMDMERADQLAEKLLRMLFEEREAAEVMQYLDLLDEGTPFAKRWNGVRALMNTRPPEEASEEFLDAQDELLNMLILDMGISNLGDTYPVPKNERMRLWMGDITTLKVDAIVNAANSSLTGCWMPLHYCIDNAIHTFAGVQLRFECARIMSRQGHDEETGQAKVTPAYNLPSKKVIHTVGPIIDKGEPTEEQCQQLAQCYISCLEAAVKADASSIAFCSISTGVFAFPLEQAAEIAVNTVDKWLREHEEEDVTVVFDVFADKDLAVYRNLLKH